MKKIIIPIIVLVLICVGVICFFILKNKPKDKMQIENNVQNEISNNEVKESENMIVENKVKLSVNGKDLIIDLENNSSSKEFVERLRENDIEVEAHDYGNFEKVGSLGFSLPTNDENIRTEAGDVILYQGNQITIYYDTNTWDFTKLGKINGISQDELKNILGNGNVTLKFSLLD